ncbi:trimeric intracellular cation channel family protein [Desulforhopalus singaporensis]|uniref:Uncharacterized membrane protein YeiH n=1 Tax=Desulforhopalus singaporensis TaxID=91360 RepID=A0A1H0NWL8_9BACT|nr:trimeric intracellular cation channel family protein [Desulforhopalus singaporensis]SDO97033.1 Uncharacterized membrane protein YeiH [Desulforhopalus singaporensis]
MIYYLAMLGVAAFAVTGVIAGGRKDMDILSVVLLGVVTAVGGGTLRDIILDTNPIFWVGDMSYLWVAVAAAVISFFTNRHIVSLYTLFLYFDAFGLALFSVLATETTLKLGFDSVTAVLMGVTTGVTGGMIRDVLSARVPVILGKEFYATPAMFGAVVFILLIKYFPDHEYNRIYGMGIIFILRILAIRCGLYYPHWLTYKGS